MICDWCRKPIELEDGEEPIRFDLTLAQGDVIIRMDPACYVESGFKDTFEPLTVQA